MCPERSRTPPPPTESTAFIFICACMPSKPARVTVMENNHLLLYKLLCKDKRWGRCVCMHLCVCWQAGVGGCFSENPLSADTLYVDCLHRRQCLNVKVILMNSNGSTDCLRQAIHNHSSFLLSPFFCPHSFFVFPVTGSSVSRNTKSFIYFFPSSVMMLNHFQ